MERLTYESKRFPGKWVLPQGHGAWRKICDKLKAYEDTGLTPDEIEDLKKRANLNNKEESIL